MFEAGITLVAPPSSYTGTPSTPTTRQLPAATCSPMGASEATRASVARVWETVAGVRRIDMSGVTTRPVGGAGTAATG